MAGRSLPKLWKVLLVALLVVATADGIVRLREDRLKPPREYYGGYDLVVDANRVEEEGLVSDVLFVGTSMVQQGVMVETIEDRLDSVAQAHNGAIAAAQTPVVKRWVLEEMLPRLGSRRVVWGVSSLDFNGERPNKTITFYNAFRATRPGVLGAVDRFLGDVFALSHFRDQLRDPALVGTMIGLGEAPRQPRGARANNDRLLTSQNQTSGQTKNFQQAVRRVRNRTLRMWAIGPDEAAAFQSTLVELLDMDIEVVVILMPVSDVYVELHPDGEADFAEFVAYVVGVGNDLGIPVFDYSRTHPDEDFHDVTHLNGEPAERFSETLAEDLAELGW